MVSPEIFRKFAFFGELTQDQLVSIAKISRMEKYDAGAVIFKEGDRADHLYLILEGEVQLHIQVDDRGNTAVVEVLSWGDPLGWSAAVEPYIMTATARCTKPATVVAIDAFGFRRLLDEDCVLCARIMRRLAQVIAARLRDSRLRLTSLMPPEERVSAS